VHLLRDFSASEPQIAAACEGGLSARQILQIADYVHEHLAQEIKLAELAELTCMSHFHFSRLFKQAIESHRISMWLNNESNAQNNCSNKLGYQLWEIALQCGFSSHSHLGKLIRQHTGLSPKAYRSSRT
jgi:AraC family transcriptional regulator